MIDLYKNTVKIFRYCLHRSSGRAMQIMFEEKRKKKKKKKRILKSTKSTNHCRQSNCTIRIDRIFFLSTKKKKHVQTNVRLYDEECEKGHLSLVPSRIFSRRLKLKFYGGYDRNHWRVNRVKLVLYDVTIATFYKASWGP